MPFLMKTPLAPNGSSIKKGLSLKTSVDRDRNDEKEIKQICNSILYRHTGYDDEDDNDDHKFKDVQLRRGRSRGNRKHKRDGNMNGNGNGNMYG